MPVYRSAQRGMSLVEILVGIALAGLLALLVTPKFMDVYTKSTSNSIGRVEQVMQMISQAIRADEAANGLDYGDLNHSLEGTIYTYGNYLGYIKVTPDGTPEADSIKYFLMPDSGRLTVTPKLFSAGTTSRPEYGGGASPTITPPLTNTQWKDPDVATAGYCGDFHGDTPMSNGEFDSTQCIFLDLNGKAGPNKIGKTGDIIPFRVDFTNGSVRSLYQAEKELNVVSACTFVSVYDVQSDPTGTATCP